VHGSQGMMKPGVMRPQVHVVGQTHLADTAQPLKHRLFYNVKNQVVMNADKTVNRIIKNFTFVQLYVQLEGYKRTGFGVSDDTIFRKRFTLQRFVSIKTGRFNVCMPVPFAAVACIFAGSRKEGL